MAITANVTNGLLDPAYTTGKKDEGVSNNLGYDEFLQLLCAEMQYQDPMEPTSNTDYIAQLATFSQLEATLTLGNSQQNEFASSLVGKEVILATTTANGAKNYVTGKVDYVMYKEGEAYLSVNDNLYPASELDTVADAGYYEAISMAKTFSTMSKTLPDMDNLTYEYEGAINQLRDLYDSMTDYQKGFLDEDDVKVFERAEEKVKSLVEVAKTTATKLAAEFKEQVDALPSVDNITLENKAGVEAARASYDYMNAYQKKFVEEDSVNKLVEAEKKLAELEA